MAETSSAVTGPGATPPRPTVPDPWRSMREEMDKLFDRFATGFNVPALQRAFGLPAGIGAGTWFGMPLPAVDITEDDGAYRIIAEIPGLGAEDVEITMSGNTLTIQGEKREFKEQKDKGYHLSERRFGAFERSFTVPEGVDRDRIGAEFAKGVLTLTLPKSAEAKASRKKIEIRTAP